MENKILILHIAYLLILVMFINVKYTRVLSLKRIQVMKLKKYKNKKTNISIKHTDKKTLK